MKLSAPIYRLKRKAKLISQHKNIPLHQALDCVAVEEGFYAWSLLARRLTAIPPAQEIFAQLQQGDLLILGARPGRGKTLMGLQLAVQATKAGRAAIFFTLEYTERDVWNHFGELKVDAAQLKARFEFQGSDTIDANYITANLADAARGTLAIVDYLQVLDQRRSAPDLDVQIRTLKTFALSRGIIFVFLSQVDRTYDASTKPFPDLGDVRLPNPLDLTLFDKTCFLNGREARFEKAQQHNVRP